VAHEDILKPYSQGYQVPPAELESVLLTHPEIADVAVVGVNSQKQATELPRAYIVHAQPDSVKTNAEKLVFADYIQRWIQSKVTRHKFLRGGKMAPLCFQSSDLQLFLLL
jgi:acyl-coenzyme A synthetase/AMP-(fatty) acid ligase